MKKNKITFEDFKENPSLKDTVLKEKVYTLNINNQSIVIIKWNTNFRNGVFEIENDNSLFDNKRFETLDELLINLNEMHDHKLSKVKKAKIPHHFKLTKKVIITTTIIIIILTSISILVPLALNNSDKTTQAIMKKSEPKIEQTKLTKSIHTEPASTILDNVIHTEPASIVTPATYTMPAILLSKAIDPRVYPDRINAHDKLLNRKKYQGPPKKVDKRTMSHNTKPTIKNIYPVTIDYLKYEGENHFHGNFQEGVGDPSIFWTKRTTEYRTYRNPEVIRLDIAINQYLLDLVTIEFRIENLPTGDILNFKEDPRTWRTNPFKFMVYINNKLVDLNKVTTQKEENRLTIQI